MANLIEDPLLLEELKTASCGLSRLTPGIALKMSASTNNHALMMEATGVPSGTVVITHRQFAGRGRNRRIWLMQEGDLALSILLREPSLPKNHALLPMIPAVAIVDALRALEVPAHLKWPNDIIVESTDRPFVKAFAHFRKIGGILIENVFKEGELAASIIGIGLNVKKSEKIQKEVPHAASISDFDKEYTRFQVLQKVLCCLDQRLAFLHEPDFEEHIFLDYLKHCKNIGQTVEIRANDQNITGQVTRVNPDGSIVVNDAGREYVIYAGDVNFTFADEGNVIGRSDRI